MCSTIWAPALSLGGWRHYPSSASPTLEDGMFAVSNHLLRLQRSVPFSRLLYVFGRDRYLSSLLRDIVCVPRPHFPQAVRPSKWTLGTQITPNLTLVLLVVESLRDPSYGMPSTCAINGVSAALLLLISSSELSWRINFFLNGALIIFRERGDGRNILGLHSVPDCLVGSLLGIFTFAMYALFGEDLERWISSLSHLGKQRHRLIAV